MNNNDNIPSSLSKRKRKEKNKENKKKEEEEMNLDNNFSIEVTPMNYSENLDFIISGLKIKNSSIDR
jgi:hypothetical protein